MGLTPASLYIVTGGGGGFALASFGPSPDSDLWVWLIWLAIWAAAIYLFVRGALGFLALMVQRGWIAREMFRQRGLPRIRIKVEWAPAKGRDAVPTVLPHAETKLPGPAPETPPRAIVPVVEPPKPATDKAEELRWPPAITARPPEHRAEPEQAFCKARTSLLDEGRGLDEGLWTVPINANPMLKQQWEDRLKPWRIRMRSHHQKFWPGMGYQPKINAPKVASIPTWVAEQQEDIRGRVRWLERRGWGCDLQPPTVIPAASKPEVQEAREASKDHRGDQQKAAEAERQDLITDGEDLAQRLRGLDLEPEAPEPTEGPNAQLLADSDQWLTDADEWEKYWHVRSLLSMMNLAERGLAQMNRVTTSAVPRPEWRQRRVIAVESTLDDLRARTPK